MELNELLAEEFELLAKLLELHGDNPFKIKGLLFSAQAIEGLPKPITTFELGELSQIKGFGKSTLQKVEEYLKTGEIFELREIKQKTPSGLIQMLKIKGLGPKKVQNIWKTLGITEIEELIVACEEHKLVQVDGFGKASEEKIYKQLLFLKENAKKCRMDQAEKAWNELISQFPNVQFHPIGELAFKVETPENCAALFKKNPEINLPEEFISSQSIRIQLLESSSDELAQEALIRSVGEEKAMKIREAGLLSHTELWDIENASQWDLDILVKWNDLKGCLHNHSTYSDGVHTLSEMANECKRLGLSYFGICDHSVSAFYANGLSIERLIQQWDEIEDFNAQNPDFTLLKGIESDILSDGSLDYPEEILKQFDFVVASVHSGLQMTEEKAMSRLIRAIENPYTSILGHPTGRLLLSREGYPIDHRKIIDACAANQVSIELNSSPYRLDLDRKFLNYAADKGVLISINPDAHRKETLIDMKYGLTLCKKAGLGPAQILNTRNVEELRSVFAKKRP